MTTNTSAPNDNKDVIKTVIRALAIIAVGSVLGIFILIYLDKTIPTELWLLTTNALTALTAMLVKTSPTQSSPPDVPKPAGEVHLPAQDLEVSK